MSGERFCIGFSLKIDSEAVKYYLDSEEVWKKGSHIWMNPELYVW